VDGTSVVAVRALAGVPAGASGRRPAVPGRRYEFRLAGRLSERARDAFAGMDVVEVPAQTVLTGTVDDAEMHSILALIQSLGLQVVSMQRLDANRADESRDVERPG
jgi:hypothetical protein